jgi:F0F1-type ATP synthase membrane subunit c/vacuolar-type H+-ATPase subunit K
MNTKHMPKARKILPLNNHKMKNKALLISILFLLIMSSCTKKEFVYDEDETFDLKASKMEQIGSLFDAIARQPEAADQLVKATEGLYTDISELLPISDKAIVQRGKARGYAFGMLLSSIARQPEAFDDMDAAARKFLGVYNSDDISDELAEITKTYATAALNQSIARQPEADSLFNVVCKRYMNFEIKSSVK